MSRFPNPALAGERASSARSSPHILEWSLRPRWRVALFLIPILAGSIWFSREVIRVAWVTFMADTVSIQDIQKMLLHDPDNFDLLHRLGLVYASDPTQINLSESVKNLRRAVALNPRRWDFWADLGRSCDFADDTACADEAFDRALALSPWTPSLQWTVGNHYLLTNRQEKAFPYFRRLVEMDPDYIETTFRLCLRATRDPLGIYAAVLPQGKDPALRFAFLEFLVSTADYENAMQIWEKMISGPDRRPDMAEVKPFLDFLIDHNQIQDAGTVWSDLQRAGVIPAGSPQQADNLLYNGNFEGPRINSGFDWRTSDSDDLVYDFSDPSAHQGSKCLRIGFVVGRNAQYDLVNQVVPLKPNTHYQLTAFVRSDDLTSESGPRLQVAEMGCGNCAARTSDPTLGTTAWHQLQVDFLTQPQTQAVRVAFWRPRDSTSRRDITGTVWLDDVVLRAVEAPAASPNPARSR